MKQNTCVMFGDDLADYHFGQDHPFGPKRYWAFKEEFTRRKLTEKVALCPPQSATEKHLQLFHSQEYIEKVKQQSISGEGYLDLGDTPARPGIYHSACTVVGTTLNAIDLIMSGQYQHAFTPIAGLHHAARTSAAGFCVFNDCGIAIEYLRQQYNIQPVAYIDIDAHHGDGVYYSFEDDENLCIVDFHQDGTTLYPGTGNVHETGSDKAIGTKLNIPLPPYTKDDAAINLWQNAERFIEKARPEFILLQCGADSLAADPITQLGLTSGFHRYVTQRLCHLAAKYSQGRVLAMGGGGYNLDNIKVAWNDVIEALIASDEK